MKKILLFIFILLSGGSVFSQIPGITYQAVIMNSDGQPLPGVNKSSVPLSDQEICLKFLFKDASGKNEYEEIISTKTDSYGMVNVVIGTGERVGGSFPTYAQIVWDAEAKFLEVSLDKEGLCANFVQFSSQQFTAVPFSLFAVNSGSSIEGPQGPVGLTGPQGEKGETGAKGDIGLTGDQGLKGDTGAQGIQGEVGLQGIKGDKGDTGLKGDTGAQGIQGDKGDAGLKGDTGAQGLQGEVGLQGLKGDKGDTGTQGIQGVVGPAGDKGDKGDTGTQGLQGEVGLQGLKGDKGEAGPAGTTAGDMQYWNGTAWVVVATTANVGAALQMIGGVPTWVGGTPPSVPDAPTIVTATASDAQATVAFTAPASDGGAAITNYTVSSSPGGITQTGTSSPITITGLANGTAYTFTVTATNSVGIGDASAASNSVTPAAAATAPDAVIIGTATAGDAEATVAFTAPASDGGAAITNYTVSSSPGGITQTGTSSPITITGLTNGTAYTFTVTATNSVGIGDASAASNSVTPAAAATAPDAVIIGTATAGDAQATVAFTAPTSDGGAAITTYTATSSPGNITGTVSQAGSGTITVTGLTNGTAYTFTVTATNSVGTGAASDPSNLVTPVAAAPSVNTVTNSTTGKVWMDRNLGASQVATSSTDAAAYGDLYQWGRGTDGHQMRDSGEITVQSSSTSPGDTFIKVSSNWYNGSNPDDLWKEDGTGVNNPCPSGFRLPTNAELSEERLSWASNDAAGAFASPLKLPLAGYRSNSNGTLDGVGTYGLYWSSSVNNANSWNLSVVGTSAGMNPFSRAYGGAVRCIQDGGSTATSATVPDAPTIGTAIAGDAEATVAFTAPISDGGAEITTYTATSSPDGINGTESQAGSGTITVTGLTNGTAYTFTVTATNSVGTGAASDPSNSVTPAAAAAPSVTTVTSAGGKIWMDRNLGATQVATSSTDAAAYGDLYQWGRGTDGHQSRTSGTNIVQSSSTSPGTNFITESSIWYIGTNPDDLWQGVSGVNNPCPSGFRLPTGAEWEAEIVSWGTTNKNAAGAFASPLKLPLAGNRSKSGGSFSGVGTIGNYWSSSFQNINNSFILYFTSGAAVLDFNYRALGGSIRCIQDGGSTATSATAPGAPTIGTATTGDAQATVAFTAPISDGGAAIITYTVTSIPDADEPGRTVTDTNSPITITGLTNGTAYTFTVTATNSVGTGAASAASNSVTPVAAAPSVTTVTNSTTGKVWMDRNLGASQVATSSTDADSYGDLYQWGRETDGHQIRTSGTTATLSTTDTPGNGNFILAPNSPNDWRSPQNDNLWQGVNGTNNPCPTGYRLPTDTEWEDERVSWGSNDAAGAIASPLKLPMVGLRNNSNGSLLGVGTVGRYWSSTVSSTDSRFLNFNSGNALMDINDRALGFAVRCLKDGGSTSTSATVPDAPTIGTATAGDAEATVAFTAPASDGGAAITTYTVTSIPDADETGRTATGTSSPITITGLTNGTAYTFTVTATNSVGIGDASAASNSVTPAAAATAPDAPTIVTATASDAQATVAFTAPASDGGAAITNYTVSSSPGGITQTGTSSPITITGLTNGTAYTFSVTATNSVGTGAASDPSNSVTPVAAAPSVTTVTNSTTGKVWMDRNLGASQVATSSTDADSYGDLYQWGRGTDGHQMRDSGTTPTLSTTDTPGNGNFILAPNSPNDWRSPQNDNLWQGVDGTNNPCPSGYRLPTETEWEAERATWSTNNAAGAFASPLILPMAGGRDNTGTGSLFNVGTAGYYWSSSVDDISSRHFYFSGNNDAFMGPFFRAYGASVRCIQDMGR